jgi:hypothetical protein
MYDYNEKLLYCLTSSPKHNALRVRCKHDRCKHSLGSRQNAWAFTSSMLILLHVLYTVFSKVLATTTPCSLCIGNQCKLLFLKFYSYIFHVFRFNSYRVCVSISVSVYVPRRWDTKGLDTSTQRHLRVRNASCCGSSHSLSNYHNT